MHEKLPSCIQLIVTYKCQCKCLMCHQAQPDFKFRKSHKLTEELDYRDFITIIDNILKYYHRKNKPNFVIDGGEPLIKPFTVDILEYLNNKKISTILNTNLGIADEGVLNRLAGLDYVTIRVSIDGYKNVHDKIRQVDGLYDSVKKKIIYLYKKNKPVEIRYTLSRLNYKSLEDTFSDLKDYISIFYLQPLIWHNKEIMDKHNALIKKLNLIDNFVPFPNLTLENEDQVKFVYDVCEKLGKKSAKFSAIKSLANLREYYLTTTIPSKHICVLFRGAFRIQPSGRAYFCFFEGPSLKEKDLPEILNFKGRKIIADYMEKGAVFPKCFRCCMLSRKDSILEKVINKLKKKIPQNLKRIIVDKTKIDYFIKFR